MKAFTLLLSLFMATNFFQAPSAKELVGVWKISDVNVDPGTPLVANGAAAARMKLVVMKLVFDIRADHRFFMKGNVTNQQIPEGVWRFDTSSNIIKVKEANGSEGTLANIYVKKDGKGQVYFRLMDTPMTLKVHK
ncbi:hypothetical protein [Mucilaginibacter lacusdianchii]|uniref:hypothetical protein n=1 Tax=Mucilaginibacter lacusdianchii TaxID=2684211 RepID=UPI00131CF33F|nr:hypothetical protein [Mucilaginibacter sp. JXJ CY 39]